MEFSHIYELHQLLSNRRTPVMLPDILDRLEISKSTFQRVRGFMVDYLGAPIESRRGIGYYYNQENAESYELPGLWFSPQELIALSLMEQLLESLQPALAKELLAPVHKKLEKLMRAQGIDNGGLLRRFRLLPQWQRGCDNKQFVRITEAVLKRERLQIEYLNRQAKTVTQRLVSPQQLVHYRDNWYLDGWCHLRKGLRTFALDAIEKAMFTAAQAA